MMLVSIAYFYSVFRGNVMLFMLCNVMFILLFDLVMLKVLQCSGITCGYDLAGASVIGRSS